MDDVLIVGAGPAGCVTATVLARAGVRVRLIDRAKFPRGKLCGDTLNPGTLAILRRLRLARVADATGLEVHGMRVTGEGGVSVTGRYPRGLHGRAIARRDFDWALLQEALGAGVEFDERVTIRGAIVGDRRIEGVTTGSNGGTRTLRAPVTIAADGRHSTLAFALGLAHHPQRPRRWAIGAYFEDVHGTSSLGEMHIRPGRYIGVAPLPNGLTNACVVTPSSAADDGLRDPAMRLTRALSADAALRDRFAGARQVSETTVLGPLAVDATADAVVPDGLLLAGDAAGFIDPMTGDGLRFAIRGAEIAAEAALLALEHGWEGVQSRAAAARRREFARKWRFNRALRALVGSTAGIRMASAGAPLAPALVRALIARAGDCDVA
jgi:geranylgeranyl reductase family protein